MSDLEQYGYRQELSRSLSFADLLIYGLIFMVPIAPFGIFGSVYSGSGGMVARAVYRWLCDRSLPDNVVGRLTRRLF